MRSNDTKARPAAVVILGATGDLALRMLLPSLYFLHCEAHLAPESRIVCVARSPQPGDTYQARVKKAVQARAGDYYNEGCYAGFVARLAYVQADATKPGGLDPLCAAVEGCSPVLYYLSLSPTQFVPTFAALKEAGLANGDARIAIEKPLGRDLASCRIINEAVADIVREDQVFRVDHYLGKDTVQNLIALRFGNALFEPLWNNRGIDHVQITVAETEGVGERWPYYDEYGALKDMVQNHVLQLLCLVAMEPPSDLDAAAVGAEKAKVLRALRPITTAEAGRVTVRGQYTAGVAGGGTVPSYVEERGAPTNTETFVAVRADIDNWRWSGVPFFLRTAKRMPTRRTEIAIQFKQVPHSIFGPNQLLPNRLLIRLQPEEDISLTLMNKTQGGKLDGMTLRAMPLSLSLAEPNMRRRIAYERLFHDALCGNRTLSVGREEAEHAWAWVDKISAAWREAGEPPKPYAAGSWGPAGAFALIERFGRAWND